MDIIRICFFLVSLCTVSVSLQKLHSHQNPLRDTGNLQVGQGEVSQPKQGRLESDIQPRQLESDAQPRQHQGSSQNPLLGPQQGSVPPRQVIFRDELDTVKDGSSQQAYGNGDLLVTPQGRRVEETQVQCLKTHMLVTFRFSAPFSGYIYPYQYFSECLMFRGHNSREANIQLKHGTCGDEENRVIHQGRSYLDPVIEHRLMIQWEQDIVCEDDSSVIVRCDRPDDYNKTVEWNLETRNLAATIQKSQHPGPKMWMEIQRGEGPTAPPLTEELVYIGDVLTLVFTLTDDVYWFDSNILSCFAVDGGEKKKIEWDSSNNQQVSDRSRVFIGETTVVEDGCSVKPKIFSHFIKEKHTTPNGNLVTLHYAHFKAFRFPTSLKLIIQCNVQVCYRVCPEMAPCSQAFHPRINEEQKRRRRRQAEAAVNEGAHEVDKVQMFRSLEVLMTEEGGEKKIAVVSPAVAQALEEYCYSPTTYYATVIALTSIILIMLIMVLATCLRERVHKPSLFTPTKPAK